MMNRLICERAGWRAGADTDYVRYGLISTAISDKDRIDGRASISAWNKRLAQLRLLNLKLRFSNYGHFIH